MLASVTVRAFSLARQDERISTMDGEQNGTQTQQIEQQQENQASQQQANQQQEAREEACEPGEHARVVRRAVRPCEARNGGPHIAPSALGEDDALGAVLFLDIEELLGNVIEGLIPGNTPPGIFPPILGVTHHGMGDTLLMVSHLIDVQATHAKTTLVERIVGVTLAFHQLAILIGIQQYAAAEMAAGARPSTPSRDGKTVLLVSPGLFIVDELKLGLCELCHKASSSESSMLVYARRVLVHCIQAKTKG